MLIDDCDIQARENILRDFAQELAEGKPREEALALAQERLLALDFGAEGFMSAQQVDGMFPYSYQSDVFDEKVKSAVPVLSRRPEADFRTDAEGAKHMVVKGDNLVALLALLPVYRGRVKFIYIDPPYNRGKGDLIYNDIFVGETDKRRHSKWLSFMALRLVVARDFLTSDGALAASIGDEEDANLRTLLSRVFQEKNGLLKASRVTKEGNNKGTHFASSLDYVHVFAKDLSQMPKFSSEVTDSYLSRFKFSDEKGAYREEGLYKSSLESRPNQRYYIEAPDGSLMIPPGEDMPLVAEDGAQIVPPRKTKGVCWRWSRARYLSEKKNNVLIFKKTPQSPLVDENGNPSPWNVYVKQYQDESVANGTRPRNLIREFPNAKGSVELKNMGVKGFDFPKPVGLIEHLIKLVCGDDKEAIVMDFFAGSGTTLHAVANLNAADNGMRQCILVTDAGKASSEGTSATKSGGSDIFEDITLLRVQRALSGKGWAIGPQPDLRQGYMVYDALFFDAMDEAPLTGFDENGAVYGDSPGAKSRSDMLSGLAGYQESYVSALHCASMVHENEHFSVWSGREGEVAISMRTDDLSAHPEALRILEEVLSRDPGAAVHLYTKSHAHYDWIEEVLPTCVREVISDSIYRSWLSYERSRKVRFFA